MANYLQDIEDMYNKLYKSKEQQAMQKKQQGLSDLDNQQSSLTNQYQELQNTLNARKQATQSQYQGLNTNLNNQLTEGKQGYYNDRNNASANNVQKVQSIKDYMAKNNLMSSGENVDAMLRSNTDLNNNIGSIKNNENQFERGIGDKRNEYSLAEQNAYTDIGNQISASEREKAQKISDILNNRRLLEDGTMSDLQAYKDELDAKKIGDINSYNEQLRQEEVARQAAEAQYQRQLAMQREQQAASLRASSARSSGSSSSSSSSSAKAQKENITNQTWAKFQNEFNDGNADKWLQENSNELMQYVGPTEYNKMVDRVNKYKNQLQLNKRQYGTRVSGGGRQLMGE